MKWLKRLILSAALTAGVAGGAQAQTFTWAGPSEIATLDPHGTGVATAITVFSLIYEPLVRAVGDQPLEPGLATKWEAVDDLHWRFYIRKNVKFHDGTPLTADDVVFSLNRLRGEGADLRSYVASVSDVKKVDDMVVEVTTTVPVPTLPRTLSILFIMSKAWSEEHGVAEAARVMSEGAQSYSNFNANGTGAFKLVSRKLDDRTVLERNPDYWGNVSGNLQKLIFRPIKDPSTRVAALNSGEVDMIDPVPVQDVDSLKANAAISVTEIPEWRNIYLSLDVGSQVLNGGGEGEGNPFSHLEVRQAMFHAIDADAIHTKVMRGLSKPTALPIGPGISGYDESLDKRPAYDPELARKLLKQAGYSNGFSVDFDCPNDRYTNGEQVCLAVVSMLAKVGIKANLISQPSALFFQKAFQKKSSFLMFGFGIFDGNPGNFLNGALVTDGRFNFSRYSSTKVDELVSKINVEFDESTREKMIKEVLSIILADAPIIPLHQQLVIWGHTKKLTVVPASNDIVPIDKFSLQE